MTYDTLKEAAWLIDEELENQIREKARQESGLTPGEAFRQAAKKGINEL